MMKGANKSVNYWDALVHASCHAHVDVCVSIHIIMHACMYKRRLMPIFPALSRSSSLGSLSPTSHFNQLLSFGNGFRSYYDGTEAQNQMDAGFMLVWESDDWTRTY